MKKFLDDNFVLQTKTAQILYHEHAKDMPIIDYHCHLSPQEIADNKKFDNLAQIWLYGDHYKWRAMRTNGVDEKYCTGKVSDWEKFEKWAETVPHTIRNPLYHWTHLELKTAFGIEKILNPRTAREIFEEASAKLRTDEFSTRNLMRKYKVEVVCTTDDPVDSLEHHRKIREDGFEIRVLPAWRPDKAMAVENPQKYNEYVDQLSKAADKKVSTFSDLMDALETRHSFFHQNGCRLSDHGLETMYADDCTDKEIDTIFSKIRGGKALNASEITQFKSAMLYHLGIMDHKRGWVQQYHLGALRNNNTRLFKQLGPDTGFDSIGDWNMAIPMSRLLDRLDSSNQLAKTILYNLNPRDNELIATMIGNFQDGSVAGKIQYGSGWWFLDQKDGMERQMNALSNLGLLSRFVGMLTDSRSFLSYPRHEYFRRIMCNLLGNDVENGEIPDDMELLGQMVKNICYYNARNYFRFHEVKI
ncbi:MAG: glucuronate isomerase [Bacteroidales bacterium]|nr:glucuronate isomerase [Bacteroidales bacterium]